MPKAASDTRGKSIRGVIIRGPERLREAEG
jgi:hypothetical protein